MNKDELKSFYETLQYGDIITIIQDLSKGDMVEDMISTSVREFGPKTREHIRKMLERDTIMEVNKRTYW